MVNTECTCCGKDFSRLSPTKIEGAVIEVCDKCVKFGIKADMPQEDSYRQVKPIISGTNFNDIGLELVSEYGKLIAKVRQNKGMSRYEFSKNLNEKESVIERLEEESLEPDDKLVRKIEDFLNITLKERYENPAVQQKGKKKLKLTIGDVIKVS
ncbi:MAG: TIGR00270 family protein [Candidatus Aenigmarchaeota archaeon]|nr:TIGR00270 family protein [Candidatus Aenigmarchaeota archaeon]